MDNGALVFSVQERRVSVSGREKESGGPAKSTNDCEVTFRAERPGPGNIRRPAKS